jgi:NADPH:quinone reductase
VLADNTERLAAAADRLRITRSSLESGRSRREQLHESAYARLRAQLAPASRLCMGPRSFSTGNPMSRGSGRGISAGDRELQRDMRAVGVTEFGGPEALHVVELPEPQAGPGEVRIRVRAAAVNPTDTLIRSGARARQLKDIPPPYVPGMDVAGVLDQIGQGVATDLRAGDRVMAIVVPFASHGAYSELVVVPAESVARVPAGATDAEAATLPMNGLTVRLALDVLDLQPGQTLAVTGAAGAVGGYAVQLGKAAGLRVIADAGPGDEQLVKKLGADVIVPRGDDFGARVRAVAPQGADAVIDGALLDHLAIPAVRDGGRVATVRGFQGTEERGTICHPVLVRSYAREGAKLDELRQQAEGGQLTLRVAATLPAEQAAEAHRRLEAGGVRGRLVLEF